MTTRTLPRRPDGEACATLRDTRFTCDGLTRVAPGNPYTTTYRTDLPDGAHEFVGFAASAAEVGWFAVTDRAYWRRCHVRPRLSVVVVSGRDFALHARRRGCRAPDCPVAAETAPVRAAADDAGVVG